MRIRLQQPILLVLVFLVLAMAAQAQTQNAITENHLTALVNTVDSAARKGNVNGVVATMTRDAKIKMSVIVPATNQER